jgi:hypothetical protein
MKSCDRHPWRYAMCPDCTAVNQSVTLRAVYDDIDTVRQEVRHTLKVKRMAEQYESRPLDDRVRAYDDEGTVIPLVNWEELIDTIERSVVGETDAP